MKKLKFMSLMVALVSIMTICFTSCSNLLKLTVSDANGKSTTAQMTVTEEVDDNDERHHD